MIRQSGKDLDKIQSLFTLFSLGMPLSPGKISELKNRGKNDPFKGFEFKSGRLRVYAFEDLEKGKY